MSRRSEGWPESEKKSGPNHSKRHQQHKQANTRAARENNKYKRSRQITVRFVDTAKKKWLKKISNESGAIKEVMVGQEVGYVVARRRAKKRWQAQ